MRPSLRLLRDDAIAPRLLRTIERGVRLLQPRLRRLQRRLCQRGHARADGHDSDGAGAVRECGVLDGLTAVLRHDKSALEGLRRQQQKKLLAAETIELIVAAAS